MHEFTICLPAEANLRTGDKLDVDGRPHLIRATEQVARGVVRCTLVDAADWDDENSLAPLWMTVRSGDETLRPEPGEKLGVFINRIRDFGLGRIVAHRK